jgi:hypothetical protein
MHPTSPDIISVLPDAKTHTKNQEDHISTAKVDKEWMKTQWSLNLGDVQKGSLKGTPQEAYDSSSQKEGLSIYIYHIASSYSVITSK